MAAQTATSGNIGAGQQDPDDSNSDFDVIAFIVSQMVAELETMLPVQVVTVHAGSGSPPAAGTVDVQLLVSLLDGSGNATQQGIVYGVPYFRLQGGPWAIVIDPAANDFGFLIASSRDISNVIKKPGIANPGSYRKYSYADGVYCGGALNSVPAATIWCKSDGTLAITDKPGNSIVSSSSGIAITTASGGDLTVNGISVTKHTHPVTGIQAGSGDVETGEPTG